MQAFRKLKTKAQRKKAKVQKRRASRVRQFDNFVPEEDEQTAMVL